MNVFSNFISTQIIAETAILYSVYIRDLTKKWIIEIAIKCKKLGYKCKSNFLTFEELHVPTN